MTTPYKVKPPDPVLDYRVVERYLMIGNERGLYEAPAPDIREIASPALDRWLVDDGTRVVRDAAALLTSGRLYRPEPALHVLARAITTGGSATRAEALALIPAAVRTSAHLFTLLRYVRARGGRAGWDAPVREAIGAWYAGRTTAELAAQVVRAPADGAWSHREVCRLARPIPASDAHTAFFRWVVEGRLAPKPIDDPGLELLVAHARLRETASPLVARGLVERWPILREALPGAWFGEPALLAGVVATLSAAGLVRWVRRLADHDILRADAPAAVALTKRLQALDRGARGGVPPFLALEAWATARLGAATGKAPPPGLEDALYELFHAGVEAMPRTKAPLLVAIDPAASTALDGLPACPGLDPRTALAALALMAVASSEEALVAAFAPVLRPFEVRRGDDLRTLLARLDGVRAGAVDGAAPIEAAFGEPGRVATFLVLGGTRPAARAVAAEDVLRRYQHATGVPARWIGVSLGRHRLAPEPPASLDALEVHGFDATVPALLGDVLAAAPVA